MADLTVSYNANGPEPKTSDELRTALVDEATALAPGLTTTLPGSLIEDMASTGTGGLISVDQMRIDTLNSVGPNSANLALLTLQAQQYGIPAQKGEGTTTVSVTFTGTPNYLIPAGFLVSDGTYQYSINEAVLIPPSGTTIAVTASGTQPGTWVVSPNTVTTLITSFPDNIVLSVNNLTAGVAATAPETNYEFRARVWDAGMFTVQGYPGALRTALTSVANVDTRQVSVVQRTGGFVVMAGGGDTYQQAMAIYKAGGDFTRLLGSTLSVTGITNANPGVVSTDITHGFSNGQIIRITGVQGMSGVNNTNLTVTVVDAHSFSIGINTTTSGTWTGGGVVTPNLRNVSLQIMDWPDTYTINYVQPLQQLVQITFRWATQSLDYLSNALILSLIQEDVTAYVNGIYAGQPLNINKLKDIFLQSMNPTVDMTLFTTLNVSVVVNGALVNPDLNTNIISGDPYSYWYIPSNGVIVAEA